VLEMNPKKSGKIIAKLRGKRTQKEIAKALKISPSAIQMYEAGNRVPRDEIKLKIAKYFHKKVTDIFYI
jgi:DNA-binding XRE family transcriptional regulator